ncbi:MAG: CvpA family protein [Christensenellaceae bacterium]|nr:CvpA family protein [Christensenellaceae bacterium]
MNILDITILVLIGLYVLSGLYRGFIPSLLNLGGFFISWVLSFLCYPLLSRSLINSEFFSSLRFYIEGAERIGNVELIRVPIATISDAQLGEIMQTAKMPTPFDTAIVENIQNQAFADQGLTTLGEYFDMTIYSVMINIISLLIIFIGLRVLLTLVTNAFSYSAKLPMLRHYDMAAGGGVALIRGFFSMHLVFAIVPIALIMLPITPVTNLLNSSFTSVLFYSGSLVLKFISGCV